MLKMGQGVWKMGLWKCCGILLSAAESVIVFAGLGSISDISKNSQIEKLLLLLAPDEISGGVSGQADKNWTPHVLKMSKIR